MTGPPDYFAAFGARRRPPDSQLLRPTVGADGKPLQAVLAASSPAQLSPDTIRTYVEGNLWMLTAEAFRYFLPAFLNAAIQHYKPLGIFVSELVGALTEPSREDVLQALDDVARIPPGMSLPQGTLAPLRDQQLEWFDSGTPVAIYRERVEGLSAAEGAAILAFFIELQDAHGRDFPFDELQMAIDRTWGRYRGP